MCNVLNILNVHNLVIILNIDMFTISKCKKGKEMQSKICKNEMKQIIAIMNQKGGVGKTAATVNLAYGFQRKGFRVLLVDCDQQCNASTYCGIKNPPKSLFDVCFAGVEPKDAIYKAGEIDILPADVDLQNAVSEISRHPHAIFSLRNALTEIADKYDYILLDTGPSLNSWALCALTATTHVLIPTELNPDSILGIPALNDAIKEARKGGNANLKTAGIFINDYVARKRLSIDLIDQLDAVAKLVGAPLLETKIRRDEAIPQARAMKQSIFDYEIKSRGAEDYTKLIDEYLKGESL